MAKKMMTEKERITQWLTDLAKNNKEFLSLKSLKYDGQEELSICDGTASYGIQMFRCLEYVASVLEIPVAVRDRNQNEIYIEFNGCEFFQLEADDVE